MSTRAFVLLYLACLLGMLGLRFGLEGVMVQVQAATATEALRPDAVMAMPPKPQGAQDLPEAMGQGEGGSALLTRARCDSTEPGLKDICYHQLARQGAERDPQASLKICALVADHETLLECISDIAELRAIVDRDGSVAICKTLTDSVKWRGQCNFGIGLALAETDPTFALARCEDAEVFRDFCRHDVVGEVALVDLAPAVAVCAREEGDTLTRKTCWHGIGKYLARRDFQEASAACQQATLSWRGNCYHGVGWGASERDPDGTLAQCDALGIYRDNCQQGVAHQLKRADPERAIALCEAIQTDEIRTRCLAFVTKG